MKQTNKKIIAAVIISLTLSLVYSYNVIAENYLSTNVFSDNTTYNYAVANTTYTITLPPNVTIYNASISITGYLDNETYIFTEVPANTAFTGSWTNPNNVNDSDYSTYGKQSSGIATYYANYTPDVFVHTLLWQVKHGITPSPYYITENITVIDLCRTQDIYQFRIDSWSGIGYIGYCWNGTDWDYLSSYTGTLGDYIYEESIYEIKESPYYYLYQENANWNSTGTVFCNNTIYAGDGNWATWTETTAALDGAFCWHTSNYSIPSYKTNTSLWQVKTDEGTANYTIPGHCWDYDLNNLVLREESIYYSATGVKINLYCYNLSGSWHLIDTQPGYRRIYEDAIWWKISQYPENIKIYINETLAYNYADNLSDTISNIDLNTTNIGYYVRNNRSIPLVIKADYWGKIILSDLQIYYEDVWVCNGMAGEKQAYNFTLYDEDNFTMLYGDISADLTYLDNVLSFENVSVRSMAICIGGGENYSIDGVIYSDVAFQNKYYLYDAMFTPTTQYINLYNYNSSDGKSSLEYYLKDQTWTEYSNLNCQMQRYYPVEHSWITVQQDLSDEFGRCLFHIKELDTEYRFRIYDGLTLKHTTGSIKFICVDQACSITSIIQADADIFVNINPTYTYDNNTKILTIDWNDPTGATSYVQILFTKDTMSSSTVICNTTIYSSAGSYECNTTGYTGIGTLKLYGSSPPQSIKNIYQIILSQGALIKDYISQGEGSFWGFGITLTMVSMGLVGGITSALVMLFASLIVQYVLGLNSILTLTSLGVIAIIAIIILMRIER